MTKENTTNTTNTTKFIRPAGAFSQTSEGWEKYNKQWNDKEERVQVGIENKIENISIKKITSDYEITFRSEDSEFWIYLNKQDLIKLKDKIEEELNE